MQKVLSMTPPFVIKKTTGSSGDGVKIIKTHKDLESLASFLNGDPFFAEEYVDSVKNHSLQFFIDKKKKIYFVGFGEQQTSTAGEYLGVVCTPNTPSEKLTDIGISACTKISDTGYFGFVGLDILEDASGNFYIIDPNIRCTAATPIYLMKDRLSKILGSHIYVSSSKMRAETPSDLICKIKDAGGFLLSMSHKSDGEYKFFSMFGGGCSNEALANWNSFKGLINTQRYD